MFVLKVNKKVFPFIPAAPSVVDQESVLIELVNLLEISDNHVQLGLNLCNSKRLDLKSFDCWHNLTYFGQNLFHFSRGRLNLIELDWVEFPLQILYTGLNFGDFCLILPFESTEAFVLFGFRLLNFTL